MIVLYYHAIPAKHAAGFRRQMEYLRRFTVERTSRLNRRYLADRTTIFLTFDDAFESFLRNAVPVLRQWGLPATVFVPTGNLGRRPSWDMEAGCDDRCETVVTSQEVEEMDSGVISIGSHTATHRDLQGLCEIEVRRELEESKRFLESLLHRPVRELSFPYGGYTGRDTRLAREAGYEVLFGTDPLEVQDGAADVLGRVRAAPDDWLIEFKLKVLGAYCWPRPRLATRNAV